MTSRIPEPASGMEAEGIPDQETGLDAKKITGDAQEGMEPPHDYPTAVEDYGTTGAEERDGEPLDGRLAREQPDVLAAVDQDADESEGVDDPFSQESGQHVGRLVEDDEGARPDETAETVAHDAGTDGGGFSAEESAMHVEPDV